NNFKSGVCRTDDEFEERLRLNPFYGYAAHNWGHHARKGMISGQVVISFLKSNAKVQASIQAMMTVKQYSWSWRYSQKFPSRITGVHLAAYFGLENATRLLQGSYNLDLKDSYGRTPLWYAAKN